MASQDLLHCFYHVYLNVVYSAKRRYLCTGNSSLSRDDRMACSLNTAGRKGHADTGHLVLWELY